jgi:hypothetical protein
MRTNNRFLVIATVLASISLSASVKADTVVFHFSEYVAGATPIFGGTEMATLVVEDIAPGTVRLRLRHLDTSYKSQYISAMYLNLRSTKSEFKYTKFVGAEFLNQAAEPVTVKPNGLITAGLAFDMRLNLNTNGPTLMRGCTVGFDMTGEGLSAASFLGQAETVEHKRSTAYSIIDVQGIPGRLDQPLRDFGQLGAVPESTFSPQWAQSTRP